MPRTTAIPVLLGAGHIERPEFITRAHSIAYRVNVMLTVLEAWAYVPADELAEAQDTKSRLVTLTLALAPPRRGAGRAGSAEPAKPGARKGGAAGQRLSGESSWRSLLVALGQAFEQLWQLP